MTPEQLAQLLKDAIKHDAERGYDYLDLDANLLKQLGPLVDFLNLKTLRVTKAVMPAPTRPVVEGDADFLNASWAVQLVGSIGADQSPRFRLITQQPPPDGWTFAGSFPGLPDYKGVENAVLTVLPSFFNKLTFDGPAFAVATYADAAAGVAEGLSFSGTLDVAEDPFGSLSKLAPTVPVSGGVVLSKDAGAQPVIKLSGLIKGLSFDLGQVSLTNVKIELKTTAAAGGEPARSAASISGSIQIGSTDPIVLIVSSPLLQGDLVWTFTITLPDDPKRYSLAGGLGQLAALADGSASDFTLPPAFSPLGAFQLSKVSVGIRPQDRSVSFVSVVVTNPASWELPIPNVLITDVSLGWQFVRLPDEVEIDAYLAGTIKVDTAQGPFHLDVMASASADTAASTPDFYINATLRAGDSINVSQALQAFFGQSVPVPNLSIDTFIFGASPTARTFMVYTDVGLGWSLRIPLAQEAITLASINLLVNYTPNSLTGYIQGNFLISRKPFYVRAEAPSDGGGWVFSGGLAAGEDFSLKDFALAVLPASFALTLPDSLTAITITELGVVLYEQSGDFSFNAALRWQLKDLPGQPTILAAFAIASEDDAATGQKSYKGQVSGTLLINKFKIGVIYAFVQNSKTVTFQIGYGDVLLSCVFSKNKEGDSILTAKLTGVTFGGMLEYLVNLVDPNLGFKLSAPWDVLNQLDFSNLSLVVNLTKKTVGFTYTFSNALNLLIVELESVGLTYVNKAGKGTVEISIAGRFFDQQYDSDDPLKWDVLNDPPPTPPGKGEQLLDLRYLGVGQNVGFRDARAFADVQSVIKALESDFPPPDSSDKNPLLSPALDKLKFTGDGNWLVGADFTIMGAVSLSVVFNDPVLYGLRVALSGEKVGKFAGLDFQILYKKVTDTIGVYHIVLTLPEAFRQLQFGAVSVTLPTVKLDIYTNGNFRIDLGFPVGLDFSQSFCVQAGYFIGYGGLYFALLDGATSERVPKITNGSFSPVIEAGLALNVGVGRTIDKGVLSGGITLTVVTIVEGVFGWFNPNDRSAGSSLFYRIQGMAAIVGKLYGSVNFVIIQASVSVTAYAKVTLTIEAYKPILVGLSLSVEVSVSLKILFFRVSFSFSMTLDLSFTIGSASTPPWTLDASQPPPLTLRQQAHAHAPRRLSGALLQLRLLPALGSEGEFDWKPRKVFPAVQTVELSLVPSLTVALPEAVNATHATAAAGATGPQYQLVMSLFAPNSVPPEARSAKEVRAVRRAPAQTEATTSADQLRAPDQSGPTNPFDLLVAGMLRWALSSYTRPPGVALPPPSVYATASDLDAISAYLADPDKWQTAFTYDALAAFMELNYVLRIRTPLVPSGLAHPNGSQMLSATEAPEVSASVFPMIPELQMGPKGLEPVQFWNHNCISRDYEDALNSYYRQLQAAPAATGATAPAPVRAVTNFRAEPGPRGCAAGEESLSTFIFRDYFAMATKGAVSGAIELLKAYPYEPTGSTGMTGGSGPTGPAESLRSIAEQFTGVHVRYVTRHGDTLGTIAGRFGISPVKLHSLNTHLAAGRHEETLAAGSMLVVNTGVTPEAIAAANSGYPLHYVPGRHVLMTVSGVRHQVKVAGGGAGESLYSICAQYGLTGPHAPGSLFTFEPHTVPPGNPNARNAELLQPGARIHIPAQTFAVASPVDNSGELVAAFFYVRSLGPASPEQKPWYDYVQFYEQWMEDNPGASGPAFWDVPVVKSESGNLVVSGAGQYAPQGASGSALAPDTRGLAAGYFAMRQLAPEPFGEEFRQFAATYVSPTGPAPGGTYAVRSFPYTVKPGDTVGGVAQLFGVGVDELAKVNVGATGMLRPLAVVALPTLAHPIAEGDTLGSVAARFDLTLDELTDSVEHDAGILRPFKQGSTPLTIPDVPGRPVAELLEDMIGLGRFNDVSGMLTRFLLHGMRVPVPGTEQGATFPPGATLWGLYEMTGQQFPVPEGATGPTGQFEVTFTKGATSSWVCLVPAPTGTTAPTGPAACRDELVMHFGPSFFENPPSLSLTPEIVAGPGALPLYRDTQRQFSFSGSIHWQAAASPTLPGPTAQPLAGQPSIWNFPPTLMRVAMQGPSGPTAQPAYGLALADPSDPSGESDTPVSHYAWGCAVDVRVQRASASGPGRYLPNTYVFLGADQQGREQLLSAWQFLENTGQLNYGQLFILYPPGAASNNSQGLASDSIDHAQTFLLKTNLTTVTRSNQSAFALLGATEPHGEYYARLAAVPDFLRLAWEASVTGSGGFFLNYFNKNGGGGLPETLFADGDTATVTLLLLASPQDTQWYPNRVLYPFNNCAVVGDYIDPGTSRLYAEAAAADLVRVAAVPPGHAGFYLARVNPEPSGSDAPGATLPPADQTRNLYNLTGYRITANDYFEASNEGLPVGPADTPVEGVSGPTGPGVWWYQQVLPAYKFGKVNDAPASPALPDASANPYAGITGATGPGLLGELDVALDFYDVYGNRTHSTAGPLSVKGLAGYTDEVIGVSSWPAAGADYAFLSGTPSGVVLDTLLSMQLDKYAPTDTYTFAQSSSAATADARRYEQIFYQVQQHDLTFELQTNLGETQIDAGDLKASMAAFVSKAKVFADACASQSQRQHETASGERLESIAAAYAVTPARLVAENQHTQVAALFEGSIVHPLFSVAGPMNTLKLLAAGKQSTPFPPVCGNDGPPECPSDTVAVGVFAVVSPDAALVSAPGPNAPTAAPAQELKPSELLTNNQTAPLTPGIVLRTQPRVGALPDGTPNTLAAAAAALQCVVYALVRNPDATTNAEEPAPAAPIEIGLYVDNFTAAGVVALNLDITIKDVIVNTGPAPTFKSVEDAFRQQSRGGADFDRGDFVAQLENVSGIFVPSVKLTHADFVVPQPPPSQAGPSVPVFNITNLPDGCGTLDLLAKTNSVVPNFFYSGAAVYISACCYRPQPFDTFASLAEQFNHITLEQLARYNSAAPLNEGVSLAIPSLTYLASPDDAFAPYTPTAADTLDVVAGKFGTSAAAVAAVNRYLPGIFAGGASIEHYSPGPLDSLQSAADALKLDFGEFVRKVAPLGGLYRTNGVIITPLPAVPDGGGGHSPALATLAGQLNVQPHTTDAVTALLTVNRSLEGFLLKGAGFAGPEGTERIKAGAHDTVDTILGRFAREQKAQVSVAQLASANASMTGLLTPNRRFLLPPNPTGIKSALAPSIPPAERTCESAIVFPVTVGLSMKRARFLVAQDFSNTLAVYRNVSAYSPRGFASGATSATLTAFAQLFEQAFRDYRLKCGVVQKDAVSDPQEAPQLYAVNFGPSGVSRFAVDATAPQFYALAPLSTELLTGTLPIRRYISGCGLGPVVWKKFDSVDLDNWMGQFLGTVDLFLSASYAVPAFQLGVGGPAVGDERAAQLSPLRLADGPVGLGERLAPDGPVSRVNFRPSFDLGVTGCTGSTGVNGPANFDAIVAAKYDLAGELSQDVVPILQVAGPTSDYYDGTAQETLYQQMLVRLSDAYTVNAVVQYPVNVQSPCVTPFSVTGGTGPIPPRVSGQIVPDLYNTPQTQPVPSGARPPVPLQDAAPQFGVSVPFFAQTIGGAHGLLQAGATAQYGGKTYTIRQSDTLAVVAEQLDVQVDQSWETWTQFIDGVTAQPMLVAGGALPVVKVARQVYTGDTIETVAEFFGTDAATVGEANQSLAGIFESGREISLKGYELYKVQPGDTLLKIAAAIKPLNVSPPLTVGALADLLNTTRGLLKIGATLYMTQALPDITLSTAKVSLGRVGGTHGLAPPLSFLFSVKHPRQYRKLFLNLKYVINELEFGISNPQGAGGYQASSWLTFLLPVGADVGVETSMSQVQIPVPLRSYPVPPTLVAQSGTPTDSDVPHSTPEQAIARGKMWDYRVDFHSANAAQDSNHVQVSFNLPGASGRRFDLSPSRVQAVFAALAEFIDASPNLVADLALLTRQPDQTAAVAVSVLDTLATRVAGALGYKSFADFAGARWPTLTYLYRLRTRASALGELSELQLTLEQGPSGQGGPTWPQVFVQSPTAPTGGTGPDAGFLKLEQTTTKEATAFFNYPTGIDAFAPVTQRFLFEERDVIQNQNASGGIYLTRNDDLIASGPLGTTGPSGPPGFYGGVPTNEAFLYQTPLVSFINPLTPFISDPTQIDVSGLSGPSGPTASPRTLAQHIENMLDAVLELGPLSRVQADSEISILCSYGFPLAGEGGPVAVTPIRLAPTQPLTRETKAVFARQLSQSILDWPGWPGPGGSGELIFDLSAFTTAASGGASGADASVKPILEFEYLRIPLKQIIL